MAGGRLLGAAGHPATADAVVGGVQVLLVAVELGCQPGGLSSCQLQLTSDRSATQVRAAGMQGTTLLGGSPVPALQAAPAPAERRACRLWCTGPTALSPPPHQPRSLIPLAAARPSPLPAGNGFSDDLNPNELVSINLMGPGNVEIMVRACLCHTRLPLLPPAFAPARPPASKHPRRPVVSSRPPACRRRPAAGQRDARVWQGQPAELLAGGAGQVQRRAAEPLQPGRRLQRHQRHLRRQRARHRHPAVRAHAHQQARRAGGRRRCWRWCCCWSRLHGAALSSGLLLAPCTRPSLKTTTHTTHRRSTSARPWPPPRLSATSAS